MQNADIFTVNIWENVAVAYVLANAMRLQTHCKWHRCVTWQSLSLNNYRPMSETANCAREASSLLNISLLTVYVCESLSEQAMSKKTDSLVKNL